MENPAEELKKTLGTQHPDREAITRVFDEREPEDRIRLARTLHGRRVQRALWHAVEGNPRVAVGDLVPVDYPCETPIVFHGKNSLPAFTEFQKICYRPSEGPPNLLWGYNETPIKKVIGPGYYVLRDTPESPYGASAFDYTVVPTRTLAGWPVIKPNHAGLSRFVYNGTVDYMRRVARDVFIGEATRGGSELDTYFVVVRELGDRRAG